MAGEIAPARGEDDGQVSREPVLDRVTAEHVRAPEVGLEFLEDGPEIGEDDVVRLDDPVRRVLPVGNRVCGPDRTMRLCQCLVFPNISLARSLIWSLAACSPWPAAMMPRATHLVEQRHRVGLRVKQPPDSLVLGHRAPAISQLPDLQQMIMPGGRLSRG